MNDTFMFAPWNLLSDFLIGDDRIERLFRDVAKYVNGKFPPVNIYNGDNEMVLDMELPGVGKKDIKIDLESRSLTVSGAAAEEGSNAYSRKFDLPFDVNQAKVSAEFKNGILRIRLPKAESAEVKRIEILD